MTKHYCPICGEQKKLKELQIHVNECRTQKTLKIYEEVEHKQLGVGCETDVASSSRSIIQNSENNDFMLYQHDQDIDMQETYDISLTDSIEDEAIAEELEAAEETNCSIATNMNESLATERGAAKWVKKIKSVQNYD
jgi:hypothetical protein